ncbi:MAG TPA: efflux RND transporter permease subunit, partial [Saprospiraceae bacterium]|nr:efflux RND transporter permease subunit [Saprospiraceae bacterium]
IQINVDPLAMEKAMLSFNDISNAISSENMDISGGQLEVGDMDRALRVQGQLASSLQLFDLVVKTPTGGNVRLQDIAEIKDTLKQQESFARLNGKNVITLNIVKRSGENLIDCADKVKAIVKEMQGSELPKDLNVVVTGDQSKQAATSFDELVNTIIIGFLLVLVVLMFFMGVTNAFFVALSVPLSVFVAFLFLPAADIIVGGNVTLNFIVLFALLFGLGIIVDDAIVVIENTHRIFENGKIPIIKAAKMAAGEVFLPVLAGTATVVAPFFPLLFWKGIVGKFMIYLPTILIFTLGASLIVAFIINPVFAASFMKPDEKAPPGKLNILKKWWLWGLFIVGFLARIAGLKAVGSFLIIFAILQILNRFVIKDLIYLFQSWVLPKLMNGYERLLNWLLKGSRPAWAFVSVFILFFVSLFALILRKPDLPFFPSGQPNFIYVYLKMPIGTKAEETDRVLRQLEARTYQALASLKPG